MLADRVLLPQCGGLPPFVNTRKFRRGQKVGVANRVRLFFRDIFFLFGAVDAP